MIKLGPHCIAPTPEARQWARVAPIVKTIDDLTVFHDAPAQALRIFRHYDAQESSTDAEGTVKKTIAALRGYTHPLMYLQLWTGAHPSLDVLKKAVNLCHSMGYMALGPSWYTGDYTQKDWDEAGEAGVDAYGPQCYWGNKGFTLDHALRYRNYWKPGKKPVLIPECGRDAVEGGKAGWQASGLTGAQYITELAAYNAEINKDSYVLGAAVFTAGPTAQ